MRKKRKGKRVLSPRFGVDNVNLFLMIFFFSLFARLTYSTRIAAEVLFITSVTRSPLLGRLWGQMVRSVFLVVNRRKRATNNTLYYACVRVITMADNTWVSASYIRLVYDLWDPITVAANLSPVGTSFSVRAGSNGAHTFSTCRDGYRSMRLLALFFFFPLFPARSNPFRSRTSPTTPIVFKHVITVS